MQAIDLHHLKTFLKVLRHICQVKGHDLQNSISQMWGVMSVVNGLTSIASTCKKLQWLRALSGYSRVSMLKILLLFGRLLRIFCSAQPFLKKNTFVVFKRVVAI